MSSFWNLHPDTADRPPRKCFVAIGRHEPDWTGQKEKKRFAQCRQNWWVILSLSLSLSRALCNQLSTWLISALHSKRLNDSLCNCCNCSYWHILTIGQPTCASFPPWLNGLCTFAEHRKSWAFAESRYPSLLSSHQPRVRSDAASRLRQTGGCRLPKT